MRLRSALVPLLLGAAVVVGACGPSGGGNGNDDGDDRGDDDGTPDGGGDDDTRPDARVRADAGPPSDAPPAEACTKMDILFVVDNSGSMEREQENLGDNFPEFARVLDEYRVESGEPLDYRVGVTTTARDIHTYSMFFGSRVPRHHISDTDNGAFRRSSKVPNRWIASADMARREAMVEVSDVGIGGSHLEMPLDAARLALSPQFAGGTDNAGFLREDALLAVVYLTDEEDCSRLDGMSDADAILYPPAQVDEAVICRANAIASPQAYVDFFDDLKGDRKRWATAVIAGDGQGRGSCTSDFGDAEDSPRLKEFVQLTGENAIFRSICDGDLAPALEAALDTFQAACEGLPPVD
jgi:hypothetical protein